MCVRFIETPVFTDSVEKTLSDEEYRSLQIALMLRPALGAVIRGSGGLRKARWGIAGRGKRGGARVIYYWDEPNEVIYLLLYLSQGRSGRPYPTTAQGIGPARTRGTQVKKSDFDQLVQSVRQAGQIKRGRIKATRVAEFDPADVKAIRAHLKKSQSEFAAMIGVSVSTLQNWEQGRRVPEGPARALLKVAAEKPRAVAQALGG